MGFQIIPLLALALYILYLSYYYATPMFFLKVLLFMAHLWYGCTDIRFTEGKIIINYVRDGKEYVLERVLEVDPTSRFFASSERREFSSMLRRIRKGEIGNEAGIAEE